MEATLEFSSLPFSGFTSNAQYGVLPHQTPSVRDDSTKSARNCHVFAIYPPPQPPQAKDVCALFIVSPLHEGSPRKLYVMVGTDANAESVRRNSFHSFCHSAFPPSQKMSNIHGNILISFTAFTTHPCRMD
ncbi:hypothetical protein DMENIID0001_134000 [Sergentomyia squamirostris]